MNKNYEFITAEAYIYNYKVNEAEITTAINYIENLQKELLPNEFAL